MPFVARVRSKLKREPAKEAYGKRNFKEGDAAKAYQDRVQMDIKLYEGSEGYITWENMCSIMNEEKAACFPEEERQKRQAYISEYTWNMIKGSKN